MAMMKNEILYGMLFPEEAAQVEIGGDDQQDHVHKKLPYALTIRPSVQTQLMLFQNFHNETLQWRLYARDPATLRFNFLSYIQGDQDLRQDWMRLRFVCGGSVIRSAAVGIGATALAGTMSAVTVQDLPDLRNLSFSTLSSIRARENDVVVNIPVMNGVVTRSLPMLQARYFMTENVPMNGAYQLLADQRIYLHEPRRITSDILMSAVPIGTNFSNWVTCLPNTFGKVGLEFNVIVAPSNPPANVEVLIEFETARADPATYSEILTLNRISITSNTVYNPSYQRGCSQIVYFHHEFTRFRYVVITDELINSVSVIQQTTYYDNERVCFQNPAAITILDNVPAGQQISISGAAHYEAVPNEVLQKNVKVGRYYPAHHEDSRAAMIAMSDLEKIGLSTVMEYTKFLDQRSHTLHNISRPVLKEAYKMSWYDDLWKHTVALGRQVAPTVGNYVGGIFGSPEIGRSIGTAIQNYTASKADMCMDDRSHPEHYKMSGDEEEVENVIDASEPDVEVENQSAGEEEGNPPEEEKAEFDYQDWVSVISSASESGIDKYILRDLCTVEIDGEEYLMAPNPGVVRLLPPQLPVYVPVKHNNDDKPAVLVKNYPRKQKSRVKVDTAATLLKKFFAGDLPKSRVNLFYKSFNPSPPSEDLDQPQADFNDDGQNYWMLGIKDFLQQQANSSEDYVSGSDEEEEEDGGKEAASESDEDEPAGVSAVVPTPAIRPSALKKKTPVGAPLAPVAISKAGQVMTFDNGYDVSILKYKDMISKSDLLVKLKTRLLPQGSLRAMIESVPTLVDGLPFHSKVLIPIIGEQSGSMSTASVIVTEVPLKLAGKPIEYTEASPGRVYFTTRTGPKTLSNDVVSAVSLICPLTRVFIHFGIPGDAKSISGPSGDLAILAAAACLPIHGYVTGTFTYSNNMVTLEPVGDVWDKLEGVTSTTAFPAVAVPPDPDNEDYKENYGTSMVSLDQCYFDRPFDCSIVIGRAGTTYNMVHLLCLLDKALNVSYGLSLAAAVGQQSAYGVKRKAKGSKTYKGHQDIASPPLTNRVLYAAIRSVAPEMVRTHYDEDGEPVKPGGFIDRQQADQLVKNYAASVMRTLTKSNRVDIIKKVRRAELDKSVLPVFDLAKKIIDGSIDIPESVDGLSQMVREFEPILSFAQYKLPQTPSRGPGGLPVIKKGLTQYDNPPLAMFPFFDVAKLDNTIGSLVRSKSAREDGGRSHTPQARVSKLKKKS